jgi:hypothetical protein
MHIDWPWSKTYQHRCPGGTVKIVYRNVDDAFPFYIKGWEGQLDAKMQGAPARVSAKYKSQVEGLLYGLDELNRGVIFDFRAAYIAYTGDPCGNGEFFQRQVDKIIHEQQRLRRLKVQIQGLISLAETHPNNPEKVFPAFQQIADQLGGLAPPAATTLEIAEVRKIMEKWIGGGSGS